MKNLIHSFAILAASVLALSACNREILPETPAETHSISFVASAPQTKTSATIDTDAKTVDYSWSSEDVTRFNVYEIVGDTYTAATEVEAEIDGDEMFINAQFGGTATSGAKYMAVLNEGVKAAQEATDKSYDQLSDVLVSEVVSNDDVENDYLVLSFKRETAFALMTAKGLEGAFVTGVSITATNDKLLAADYDAKTTSFAETGSNTIIVDALSSIVSGESPVFLATVPVTDASLKVAVVTTDVNGDFQAAYEKSFAEGKSISFSRGDVRAFGIGMAKVEDLTLDLSTDQTTTASTEEMTWNNTFVSVVAAKAGSTTNANNYYPGTSGQSYSSTRFYKNSTFSFTPRIGLSIKEIVYAATTTSYATNLANSTWTNATASASGTTVTIIPEDGTAPVSAVIGGTTGATEIVVTYGIPVQPTTHSVTIDTNIKNGSVTATPSSDVMPGTMVTLTATPEDGYVFGSWNVTNVSTSEPITVTDNKFTMPDADVNVNATFSEIQEGGDAMTVDFESEISAYTDWTFTSITSKETNSNVPAHGGSYFGSTDGKQTGSVQTKDKVANPGTITFYISKASTNTTASSWKIQTSSNGTSWSDAKTVSASSVTRGQWTEVSQDLSGYSNVYVRVYYDGTTAVRCIDDLTLTLSSGSSTTYTITVANDIANGTVAASHSTAAEGAEVTLTATPAAGYEFGSWSVTNASTDAEITVTDNKFKMPAASVNVSATFKEKELPALATMDAIFAAATTAGSTATDVKVTFNNWVVSGVKNNNAYLTDNNGKGLIIYSSGHGFEVGDILSGTVICKVQLYNGSSELTTLTSSTSGLTVTKGGVVTPKTIAISDLSGVNTGAVLTYESLNYDGTTFSDGNNTITPYSTFMTLPTLESGKSYSVTGVYIQYRETKEIAPRTTNDIVEIVDIVAGPTTVTWIAATANDNPGDGAVWNSSIIDDNISWSATKGTGSFDPKYHAASNSLRMYPNSIFTISASNGKRISKIVLTFSGSSYSFDSTGSDSSLTYNVSSISQKWFPTNECRLQKIEVTYE